MPGSFLAVKTSCVILDNKPTICLRSNWLDKGSYGRLSCASLIDPCAVRASAAPTNLPSNPHLALKTVVVDPLSLARWVEKVQQNDPNPHVDVGAMMTRIPFNTDRRKASGSRVKSSSWTSVLNELDLASNIAARARVKHGGSAASSSLLVPTSAWLDISKVLRFRGGMHAPAGSAPKPVVRMMMPFCPLSLEYLAEALRPSSGSTSAATSVTSTNSSSSSSANSTGSSMMSAGSSSSSLSSTPRWSASSYASFVAPLVARDIARALSVLHSHSVPIVHRDIKTDNILADIHGNFYLSDFGLAVYADGSSKRPGGNYISVPPEVSLERSAPANPAADIWSLGVVVGAALVTRDEEPARRSVSDDPRRKATAGAGAGTSAVASSSPVTTAASPRPNSCPVVPAATKSPAPVNPITNWECSSVSLAEQQRRFANFLTQHGGAFPASESKIRQFPAGSRWCGPMAAWARNLAHRPDGDYIMRFLHGCFALDPADRATADELVELAEEWCAATNAVACREDMAVSFLAAMPRAQTAVSRKRAAYDVVDAAAYLYRYDQQHPSLPDLVEKSLSS